MYHTINIKKLPKNKVTVSADTTTIFIEETDDNQMPSVGETIELIGNTQTRFCQYAGLYYENPERYEGNVLGRLYSFGVDNLRMVFLMQHPKLNYIITKDGRVLTVEIQDGRGFAEEPITIILMRINNEYTSLEKMKGNLKDEIYNELETLIEESNKSNERNAIAWTE